CAPGAGTIPRPLSRSAVPDGPEGGGRVDRRLGQQRGPYSRSVRPQDEAFRPQGAAMALTRRGGEGGAKPLIYRRRRLGGGGGAGVAKPLKSKRRLAEKRTPHTPYARALAQRSRRAVSA